MLNDPLLRVYLKYSIIALGIVVIICIIRAIVHVHKRNQLKRYKKIYVDMPEEVMLSIMGKGYNKSSLKNNTFKYEWRMKSSSYGSSSHGFSARTYTGVRKLDIYVKDGKVTEIKPYNV